MSDTSQGPGWWLASDGRWYPPTARPGVPLDETSASQVGVPSSTHSGMTASLPGRALGPVITVITQTGFALVAALNLLLTVLIVQTSGAFEDFDRLGTATAFGNWYDTEDRMLDVGNITFWLGIAATITFIVWSWRAHAASDRLRPHDRKYGRGWTIAAWLIPIANLILPKLVVGEIERIARAPRDGGIIRTWGQVRGSAIGWLWWIGHVAGTALARVARTTIENAETADDVRRAYSLLTTAGVAATIGLVLGVVYIGRISRPLSPEAFARSNAMDPSAPIT